MPAELALGPRFRAGRADYFGFHLAGWTSYYLEDDHLLIVEMVLAVDCLRRLEYRRVARLAAVRGRNWVQVVSGCLAGLLVAAEAPVIMAWGLTAAGFSFFGLGLLFAGLGLWRSRDGQTRLLLELRDGGRVELTLRGGRARRNEFIRRLVGAIRQAQPARMKAEG